MTISELLDRLEQVTGDLSVGSQAYIDQLSASLREDFDELDLPLTEERVALASVATIGALLDLTFRCRRADAMSAEEGLAVASALSIMARALVPFVPEGCR